MRFHISVQHDDPRVIDWCHEQDIDTMPENHGMTWTWDQDKHLLRCYKNGWPVLAIARFLKRNCYAIVCRLNHHDLDWRKVMFEYTHTGKNAAILQFHEDDFPFHPKEKPMKENINGRFWMIQNGDIKTSNGLHCKDKFGRSMVEWPGRSIFQTKKEAELAAADMAERFPNAKFYVMEAVCMFETAKPPVHRTTWKPSK